MKLRTVKINNYKSFGEEDNVLFIDKLNVIIGKNESGKSNLIDALANINYIGATDKEYFSNKNVKSSKNLNIILNFEIHCKNEFIDNFEGNAQITLDSYNNYLLSGDLSKYIENNKKYNEILSNINILVQKDIIFPSKDDLIKFNNLVDDLKNAKTKIFINNDYYIHIINFLKESNIKDCITLSELIEQAINFLKKIYVNFPRFVKIENKMLKSTYNVQEIENFSEPFLRNFLIQCGININMLIETLKSSDIDKIKKFEEYMNDKTENFSHIFNEFYDADNIKIKITIDKNKINIIVDTHNENLQYEERSNGLKWYIGLLIQLLTINGNINSISTCNVILIDEPAVYLHPNAQREVLRLFADFVKRRGGIHQLIYTTHSPFMIDTETVQNVRAVVKDNNGISHIHNKITTMPANSKSTYDTITPLINAIGLNLSYNIGPAFDSQNVIVEGMSDYFYLNGYYRSKQIENIPNIIPSTGGDNISAIASILFGWKCKFNILLDQDDKGRSVYDSINDSKQSFLDKLIFVDNNTQKVSGKRFEIEDLFSIKDKIRFGMCNEDYNEHKYNYSYIVYNKILYENVSYDEKTIKNFDELIEKINNLNMEE